MYPFLLTSGVVLLFVFFAFAKVLSTRWKDPNWRLTLLGIFVYSLFEYLIICMLLIGIAFIICLHFYGLVDFNPLINYLKNLLNLNSQCYRDIPMGVLPKVYLT